MHPKTELILSEKAHFYQSGADYRGPHSREAENKTSPEASRAPACACCVTAAVLLYYSPFSPFREMNEISVTLEITKTHDNINPHTGSPTLEMKPPRILSGPNPRLGCFLPIAEKDKLSPWFP